MPCLPGYSKEHHQRLQEACFAALAPGTWRNKQLHAACFSEFMVKHKANVRSPTVYDVLSFILFLKDKLSSPGAMLNYFWGARSAVALSSGLTSAFDAPHVLLLRKGISRSFSHNTKQAPPLTPQLLRKVIDFLTPTPTPLRVVKAALLLAYFTLLRQSNLLPRSVKAPRSHELRLKDLILENRGLTIVVRSSKTITSLANQYSLFIPEQETAQYCPVRAWKLYLQKRPLSESDLPFVTRSGRPLTSVKLVKVLRLILCSLEVPNFSSFTLHSFRRGGGAGSPNSGSLPERYSGVRKLAQ